MQRGVFLFTLDTELAWGHYDIYDAGLFSTDGSRERRTVIRILELLDEYDITATWAIVGRLFCKDHLVCKDIMPLDLGGKYPQFEAMIASDHPLLYAPDLIETLIVRGARHEIGFHGFTHRIFTEMAESEARAEIEAWSLVAAPYGIQPKTVVFPRNRIKHLALFSRFGFLCFRGTEKYPGFVASPSVFGKGLRRYYRYTSLAATPEVYQPWKDTSGLYNLPASRSLFSIDRTLEQILRGINLRSVTTWALVRGVKQAVREKGIFHLYTHPYEFQSEEDFTKLRRVIQAVRIEMNRGSLVNYPCASLTRILLKEGGV